MRHDPVDRWDDIDALFDRVLDLPSADRAALLDETCKDAPELRDALERLLRAKAEAGPFLETPVDAVVEPEILSDALDAWGDSDAGPGDRVMSDDPARTPADRSGEIIGPYRLVRLVGRGGMASVYLAERADGQWHRKVALKLLRRGLDTDDLVRRFVSERQILSSLSHPSIARLLDGGATDDGLPYLVMDYVEGTPITRYCEEDGCTVDERLRLFQEAGRAVQYAHANLVVHRDLKPSNILVTADGRVILLDFGIAKLLDPEAGIPGAPRTRTGFQPLTPEYASPEQIRGETITTASDVYQLGMLLYRMLTGRRPFEIRSIRAAALAETIERTDPARPSSVAESERLRRRLRGDLDVIVLKALRKEPERRYGSAIEMVEDVRRHLEGRPITARRESRSYRMRKFLRRNAWIAAAVAVVLLVLGGYIATLIRYGHQLEGERNVARAEAAKATEVTEFLVGLFQSANPYTEGERESRRDITVREALLEGAERVRSELADQPEIQAQLLGNVAEVLMYLEANVEALSIRNEALALETGLYGPESPQVAATLWHVADLTASLGDADAARVLFARQLEMNRRLHGPLSAEAARSLESLGVSFSKAGRPEEAVAYLEEAVRIYRVADSVPPDQLASALGYMADAYRVVDRVSESVAASREAVDLTEADVGPESPATAIYRIKYAQALSGDGRLDEAARQYERALPVLERELGPDHLETLNSLNNYAITIQRLGRLTEAEELNRRLLAARTLKYGETDRETIASMQNLAVVLSARGAFGEADSLLVRVYDLYYEQYGRDHYLTAFPLLTLSGIRLKKADFAGALAAASEARDILSSTLPSGHYATAVATCRVGRAQAGLGDKTEALAALRSSVRALEAARTASAEPYLEECREALEALESEQAAA